MKKILLFLLVLSTLSVHAQLSRTATFNLQDPTHLNPPVIPATSNGGYVNLIDYVFEKEKISVSFVKPESALGAYAEFYTRKYSDRPDGYDLGFSRGVSMKISAVTGCTIDRIVFTGAKKALDVHENGIFVSSSNIWTKSSNTSEVVFTNWNTDEPAIESITVEYTEPAVELEAAFSPTSSAELMSFSQIELSYTGVHGALTLHGTSAITIVGNYDDTSLGEVNATLSPSVSGSVVTLSLTPAIEHDGTFTITIPEGTFADSDGHLNKAQVTYVTVREDRTVFNPIEITPAEGSLELLPEVIKLCS